MPDVILRSAALDDAGAIASLAGELGYPATATEMTPRLQALLGSRDDAVLVAVDEDAVIGWIHVAAITLVESAPHAEIRGLVVTASRRAQNIGSKLVDAAARWASDRGLPRIRVRSNVTRERTHAFYEKRGYKTAKTQKVFDKLLS